MQRKSNPIHLLNESLKKNREGAASYLGALTGAVSETPLNPLEAAYRRFQQQDKVAAQNGQAVRPLVQRCKDGFKVAFPNGVQSAFFKGLGANVFQRVVQRSFSFGTQPVLKHKLSELYGDKIQNIVGVHYRSTAINAMAGLGVGVFSVGLLPLDYIKVRQQLDDPRSIWQILSQDKMQCYRGWRPKLLVDASSYSVFFSSYEAMRSLVFHTKEGEHLPLHKSFFASFVSGVAATTVSNPFDILKTRVQKPKDGIPTTGWNVFKTIYAQEGFMGFTKGLPIRLLTVVPRLVVVNTVVTHAKPIYKHGLFKLNEKLDALLETQHPTPGSSRRPT